MWGQGRPQSQFLETPRSTAPVLPRVPDKATFCSDFAEWLIYSSFSTLPRPGLQMPTWKPCHKRHFSPAEWYSGLRRESWRRWWLCSSRFQWRTSPESSLRASCHSCCCTPGKQMSAMGHPNLLKSTEKSIASPTDHQSRDRGKDLYVSIYPRKK